MLSGEDRVPNYMDQVQEKVVGRTIYHIRLVAKLSMSFSRKNLIVYGIISLWQAFVHIEFIHFFNSYVAGSCEHGDEPSGFIKFGVFSD
jgi:hypothetical protein